MEVKENILIDKSIEFAARIIKLQRYLVKDKKESVISKQIVRCGTSIGANINEANYGQSNETEYWLRLLVKSELLTNEEGESLLKDCLEIKRVLISSIKTAKKNNN